MQVRMVEWLVILLFLLGCLVTGCKKEPEFEGKSMNEWLSLLRNPELKIRERASDVLARHATDSLPHLKRFLSATDPTLRKSVVTTLAAIGPGAASAVESLLKRLAREQVAIIRAEILRAIALIDPKATGVAEEFQKRLRDEDPRVQQAAQAGLDTLNPPETPGPDTGQAESTLPEEYQLRDMVGAQLEKENIAFGLVAEVVRENRRAAIVWPAIHNNQLTESKPVAFVYKHGGDNQWIPIANNVDLSSGPDRLVDLLEGADKQRVVRACGVDKAGLPAFLVEQAVGFRVALAEKKPREAMHAFEQLSKAFSFRLAAYSDTLSGWLQSGAIGAEGWKLEQEAESENFVLQMPWGGTKRTGEVRLSKCSDGYAIAEINWIDSPEEQ